jgi:hypothetical protein
LAQINLQAISKRSVLLFGRKILAVALGVGLLLSVAHHAHVVVHGFIDVSDVVGHPSVFATDVELGHSFGKTLLSLGLNLRFDLLLHALLPLGSLLVDLVLVASLQLTQASALSSSETMIRTSLLEGSKLLLHLLGSRNLLLDASLLGCDLDLHQLVLGQQSGRDALAVALLTDENVLHALQHLVVRQHMPQSYN